MRHRDTEKRRHGEANHVSDAESNLAASPRRRVAVSRIDWTKVNRVLVVRLRSIGDTVLATPSLDALRRFLPGARIDVLLEDWVAPVLDGFDAVDNVLSFKKDDFVSRLKTARRIRRAKYDAAFNLHGGTTATFFVRASGARHRIGYAENQYNFLYNHLLSSSADFWQKEKTHSAEQQLALLGFAGVPVADKPKSRLVVTDKALNSLEKKFNARAQADENAKIFLTESGFQNSAIRHPQSAFALIHPVAAFDTKQWATENFAQIADFLHRKKLPVVAVATKKESEVLEKLKQLSLPSPVLTFDDLTLPEITALASKASLFVGNDSGIAHIAAAVGAPSVVIFGSSNIHHWRPWTNAPNEIVYETLACQPCAGYFCGEFGEPKCIHSIKIDSVIRAIEKILGKSEIHVKN
ncbi:MAG: glycosyltransferase family 9 protein [Acidobacteriota bacterium]|nr:glycosyltransferase family 9 protein [Acidobacteriota bacterium]